MTDLTKGREWVANNLRQSQKRRRGREKRSAGKGNILPAVLLLSSLVFEAKYTLILNDKGSHRDLKPNVTILHLRLNNIVFQSLICYSL